MLPLHANTFLFSKRNERFFLAGRFLVDLIDTSVQKVMKTASSSRREKLDHISQEASKLRDTLLKVSLLFLD